VFVDVCECVYLCVSTGEGQIYLCTRARALDACIIRKATAGIFPYCVCMLMHSACEGCDHLARSKFPFQKADLP
jgi:hypothetical protein